MSAQFSSVHSTPSAAASGNPVLHQLEKFCTGVALTVALSLAVQGLAHSPAHANDAPVDHQTSSRSNASTATAQLRSLPDGAYLYGQAPKPEQLGATYLVFEVSRGSVTGAFYMPRSSFDCVHGTVQSKQLALTVVNSYEQASYPYSVALQSSAVSASAANPEVAPASLEGYYPIKQLSTNDKRILSTCKASYAKSL